MEKPRVDLTGQRFGRLLVVEYLGTKLYSGKLRGNWLCSCDCGKDTEQMTFSLRSSGVLSCGCRQREAARIQGKLSKTHGLRGTKEYSCWANMVQRATNPNSLEFNIYGPRGIYGPWKTSFEIFIEHIGMMPTDGKRYSIERVDNTVGYFPDNVMWLVQSLQPRNQSQRSDNKSGVTGVHFQETTGIPYWVASWVDNNSKPRAKCFSVNKLGFDAAKQMAIEHRRKMLKELEEMGIFYSKTHGVPRSIINNQATEEVSSVADKE